MTARGAAPVGTTNYPIPTANVVYVSTTGRDTSQGTLLYPFATVGHAVNYVPAGGTVVVRKGLYHESFTTKAFMSAVTVQNYPGEAVWFDGSSVVSDWHEVRVGLWAHYGIPTKFADPTVPASYLGGDLVANRSDQVFVNGVPLRQVAVYPPGPGEFYVDYAASVITIGTIPAGLEVRVSDLRYLCVASSPVSWKGIGVRRYSPDNTGSVSAPLYYGGNSAGSVLENVVVHHSALGALNLNKHNITVKNCTINGNGYFGIGGTTCDGLVIDSCIIVNNNTGLFKTAPATGGIKITDCAGLNVTNNLVVDNNGANGIWTDVSCASVLIAGNEVSGNHRVGIQQEESANSSIYNNTVTGGQFGITLLVAGARIRGNKVSGQSTMYLLVQNDRIGNVGNKYLPKTVCPWDVRDTDITGNTFGPGTPTAKVRVLDSYSNQSASDLNVTLRNNVFQDASGTLVQWGSASKGFTNYTSLAALQAAEPVHTSGNTQPGKV